MIIVARSVDTPDHCIDCQVNDATRYIHIINYYHAPAKVLNETHTFRFVFGAEGSNNIVGVTIGDLEGPTKSYEGLKSYEMLKPAPPWSFNEFESIRNDFCADLNAPLRTDGGLGWLRGVAYSIGYIIKFDTFRIVDITLPTRYRNQGLFQTVILREIHRKSKVIGLKYVSVTEILTKRFQNLFERLGWERIDEDSFRMEVAPKAKEDAVAMDVNTSRVTVALTVDQMKKLDTLRMIYGPKVSRAQAVRRVLTDRYAEATGKGEEAARLLEANNLLSMVHTFFEKFMPQVNIKDSAINADGYDIWVRTETAVKEWKRKRC